MQTAPVSTFSQSVQRPSVPASTPANFITHAPVAPPTVGGPSVAPPAVGGPAGTVVPPTAQSSAGPTKFDLLADFGSDPFAAPTKPAAVSSM